MVVNGYEVEEAPNGACGVHHPARAQQGWRFATRHDAVVFRGGCAHPPHPRRCRATSSPRSDARQRVERRRA